ncbi:MAG: thioredoxin family protein [Candidatus Taylorbacteria bacterium]|nr:thioredoxin family protein [Candidatus Taylorbacteria bacterium]
MNTQLREHEGKIYVIGSMVVALGLILIVYTHISSGEEKKNTNVGTSTNRELVKEVQGLVKNEKIYFEENAKGIYEAYAPEKISLAKDHKVILFFKADWCPSCVTADQSLNKEFAVIPKDIAILKVSYDTEHELRKRYGVTVQHTFVQIDGKGDLVTKWLGGTTVTDILRNVR